MPVEFSPPLANSRDYPPARILATPHRHDAVSPSALPRTISARNVLRVNMARSGLWLIAATLNRERCVWVPAYHCPALVQPLLAAGLDVQFYPLTAQLDPDLHWLRSKHRDEEPIVGIRYFGFESGLGELGAYCRDTGSLFIEDLAHAAFAESLLGDVAVTSLPKFFPVNEGGEVLLSSTMPNRDVLVEQHSHLPGIWEHRARAVVRRLGRALGVAPKQSQYRYFARDEVSRLFDPLTRRVMEEVDQRSIRAARRRHYQYLATKLASSRQGKVLFPNLGEDTVPYVLPFLLNDAETFHHLRKQGIQIYRWEELADTACAVSADYRSRLIQLPVHQDLNVRQMDLMALIVEGESC